MQNQSVTNLDSSAKEQYYIDLLIIFLNNYNNIIL